MLDMVEELAEEGSATIYFGFDGADAVQRTAVGYAFASILRSNGYPVVWNENPDSKVGVVVNRYSLPSDFHEDMQECVEQFVGPDRVEKITRLLDYGVTGPRDMDECALSSGSSSEVESLAISEEDYATDETIDLEELSDEKSDESDEEQPDREDQEDQDDQEDCQDTDYEHSGRDSDSCSSSSIDLTTDCEPGCTCVNCVDE
jgi:hypothetical protein